jgi:hypothetical protein
MDRQDNVDMVAFELYLLHERISLAYVLVDVDVFDLL